MKGRRQANGDEIPFGSDCFLDVISNVIGILIILIVVVGMRVKSDVVARLTSTHATSVQRQDEESLARKAAWQSERDRIEGENRRLRAEYDEAQKTREKELARRERLLAERQREEEAINTAVQAHHKEIQRRSKLLRQYEEQAARLGKEIALLTATLDEADGILDQRKKELERFETQVATTKTERTRLQSEIRNREESVARQQTDVDKLRGELDGLSREMARLQKVATQTTTVVHYASPVSHKVDRKEAHFRCMRQRIAEVRMDDLVSAMKFDVANSKDLRNEWTASGEVGPIGGFRLRYLLRRADQSLSERVQEVTGTRLELVGFEIRGDSEDLGEGPEGAVQAGSEFLRSLARRPAKDYAITLWVYPDSFALAKVVQTHLHEKGYSVALRPLPEGVPISASPSGSASRTQ